MSVEVFAVGRSDGSGAADGPGTDRERVRPNVSGDLPTLFQAGPMFRRAVVGYDPFQVDTYVQWAEEELATADREREHLLARHLATRTALDEAEQLLAHSPSGGEFLRSSSRIAALLASAADEAEGMRAEAQADRAAASAEAAELTARAERIVADAVAEAERMLAEAGSRAAEVADEAARILSAAEQSRRDLEMAAEARLEEVRAIEQRAAEQADLIRQQALEDAALARMTVQTDIAAMLGTARQARRRADEEAAATRDRLDREAAERRALLLAEVSSLEQRRSALLAQFALLDRPAGAAGNRLGVHARHLLERLHWRPRSLRAP